MSLKIDFEEHFLESLGDALRPVKMNMRRHFDDLLDFLLSRHSRNLHTGYLGISIPETYLYGEVASD